MKLLIVSNILLGLLVAATPVNADEALKEHDTRPLGAKILELKEQNYQKALEWQRQHVKHNWAQTLNGKYSDERVDENPQQNFANQSQYANMRRQWKQNPGAAAPTLVSPRQGEFKRLSDGFGKSGTSLTKNKESKLGLNLGNTAGSSLHVDKQGLKKEAGSLGGQQEYEPTP